MSAEFFKPFINHLEFLGYEIKKNENSNNNKDKEEYFKARHERYGSVFFKRYLGGLLFIQYYRINKYAQTERSEFLEFLNELNSKAYLVTYSCLSDEDAVRMDAVYFGSYEKTVFGKFLNCWQFDTDDRIYQHEMFDNYFSD
jgi:hypothetical protein